VARRIPATEWLERLDAAREASLRGEPEGIHQVRVIARRLRVWLALAKADGALDEELRWLIKELGPLRDLDVLDEVLTTQARSRLRPRAISRAVDALEADRFHDLRETLGATRPPRRKRALRVLSKLERRFARAHFTADDESLHRLRRRLHTLRYAREWLELDARNLAADQAWLGALCDLLALARLARTA
jgi:CHAD domain-containing protein